MGRDVWRLRPGPLVVALIIPAVVLFGIGVVSLRGLLHDPGIVGLQRALSAAGLLLATAGVPVWLVTLHVSVRITERDLHARLWPLFSMRVPLAAITSVDHVAVEPLGEFGGLGVKGSRRDRMLGFLGDEGARISYVTDAGDQRHLTLLTPQAATVVDALNARLSTGDE